MPESIKNFGNTLILWKVAILEVIVHALQAMIVTYLAAMGNQTWASLDGDSRFKLGLGLFSVGLGIAYQFIKKAQRTLATGDVIPPAPEDDTQIVNKPS